MKKRPNILLIISDEHDPNSTGCYGHPFLHSPALDRLAARGICFDRAYCNSPICVPSRMSFLTGRYVHEIGTWDNGSPLRSETPSFATYLQAAGYQTALCGRMHMIGPDRLHGFGLRLYDDLTRWQSFDQKPIRNREGRRVKGNSHVSECGPGHHLHHEYDKTVTDLSCRFLENAVRSSHDTPWLLVTGYMLPHFPLLAPQELFDSYHIGQVTLPKTRVEPFESQHPAVRQIRFHHWNEELLPEEAEKKALASYYALVTMMDRNIGRLLDIVENTVLRENTVVLYLSDHGEMAGRHGMWQKMCFYEPSVRVPLIISGLGWPEGKRIGTNVSLVDIFPTLLEMVGERLPPGLPGMPLQKAVDGSLDSNRVVFSEFHAQGLESAGYMVKQGDFKYNHYVGLQPQLFNSTQDPAEIRDLRLDTTYEELQARLEGLLRSIVDPEAADQEAKANQLKEGLKRAY